MQKASSVLFALCIVFMLASCGVPSEKTHGVDLTNTSAVAQTLEPTQTIRSQVVKNDEPSPEPVVTLLPSPSPTPTVSIRRIMDGGCCVQPSWSPDSQKILYIDRPSAQDPSGLWSVSLDGAAPEFFTDRLGIYSADMNRIAFLQSGQTVVEDLSTSDRWVIPSGGRAVSFSPDGEWLAWTSGEAGPPFDTARRDVWISRFDGSDARNLVSVIGGSFAGWFPDGRLLISGRLDTPVPTQAYWALSWDDDGIGENEMLELGRGSRNRNPEISPDGRWLVYLSSLNENPNEDGLWLVDTKNGVKKKLALFGAYHWRDETKLLIVPLDLTNPMHRLMQIEVYTGNINQLTDPSTTPFRIANGDWSVSPDGKHIAFLSAEDRNIWVLALPQ